MQQLQWNKHPELKGRHARFSPSSPASYRYTDEQIVNRYHSDYRKLLGTEIHEFVACQIELGVKCSSMRHLRNLLITYIFSKYQSLDESQQADGLYIRKGRKLILELDYLPQEVFDTVKVYINDAIGYKMNVEQPLYYSNDYYGTADAIIFRDNLLRIHDLKTGAGPTHIEQLMNYAALFCLEYKIKPGEIEFELCIYQNNDILIANPDAEDIAPIMDRIVSGTKLLTKIEQEG